MDAKPRARMNLSERSAKQYQHLVRLIEELKRKDPSPEMASLISAEIALLNDLSNSASEIELLKTVAKTKHNLISKVEKHMKIVPKDFYQNQWLALGMAAFGIPLGVVVATAMDNMALFATGLPIGLGIGMAYGARLDKTAKEKDRQLDIEIQA